MCCVVVPRGFGYVCARLGGSPRLWLCLCTVGWFPEALAMFVHGWVVPRGSVFARAALRPCGDVDVSVLTGASLRHSLTLFPTGWRSVSFGSMAPDVE